MGHEPGGGARGPRFALARAGLADVHPSVESAMVAARRALELDPTLGEACAALGMMGALVRRVGVPEIR